MKGRRVRLLTVAGAGATADVVAAADVPVGELQPALARLVGAETTKLATSTTSPARDGPPPGDPRWVLLRTPAGTVLDPAATLYDQQVQDGEVLALQAAPGPTTPDHDPGSRPPAGPTTPDHDPWSRPPDRDPGSHPPDRDRWSRPPGGPRPARPTSRRLDRGAAP